MTWHMQTGRPWSWLRAVPLRCRRARSSDNEVVPRASFRWCSPALRMRTGCRGHRTGDVVLLVGLWVRRPVTAAEGVPAGLDRVAPDVVGLVALGVSELDADAWPLPGRGGRRSRLRGDARQPAWPATRPRRGADRQGSAAAGVTVRTEDEAQHGDSDSDCREPDRRRPQRPQSEGPAAVPPGGTGVRCSSRHIGAPRRCAGPDGPASPEACRRSAGCIVGQATARMSSTRHRDRQGVLTAVAGRCGAAG